MSRHEIPAIDPRHKIVVGWDHPLLTYFGQVIDRAKEEAGGDDKIIRWVGASCRGEIYEIDELARQLRKYVTLTPEIRVTLYADKDEGR